MELKLYGAENDLSGIHKNKALHKKRRYTATLKFLSEEKKQQQQNL